MTFHADLDLIFSPTVSEDAKDLILRMLNKNPDERITLPGIKVRRGALCGFSC